MDVKRGMICCLSCGRRPRQELKKVTLKEEIAQVGTISANADAEIAVPPDAMKKVGKEGVITVEEAKSMETEL